MPKTDINELTQGCGPATNNTAGGWITANAASNGYSHLDHGQPHQHFAKNSCTTATKTIHEQRGAASVILGEPSDSGCATASDGHRLACRG